MLFPVVARELRSAARRPATYRFRLITGFLFSAALAFAFAVLQTGSLNELGQELFNMLHGLLVVLGLFAGPRLTSDLLREEKREGTLGLLFLTRLKPVHVVMYTTLGATVGFGFWARSTLLRDFRQLARGRGGEAEGGWAMRLINALFNKKRA